MQLCYMYVRSIEWWFWIGLSRRTNDSKIISNNKHNTICALRFQFQHHMYKVYSVYTYIYMWFGSVIRFVKTCSILNDRSKYCSNSVIFITNSKHLERISSKCNAIQSFRCTQFNLYNLMQHSLFTIQQFTAIHFRLVCKNSTFEIREYNGNGI